MSANGSDLGEITTRPVDHRPDTCPRCGTPRTMRRPPGANALSRWTRTGDTVPLWVCDDCGNAEALQEHFGALTPPDRWVHPATIEDRPTT